MGSKIVYKKIKKNCIKLIVIGSLVAIPLLLAGIFLIRDNEIPEGMVCIGFSTAGVVALIVGIYGMIFPEKNKVFITNPDVIQMVDELYAGIIYDDGKIIMSERLIAAKKDPLTVTMLNEVLLIYIYKQSVNYILTEKSIIFDCLRDTFSVNMSTRNTKQIIENINTIASHCPNARVGFTPENQLYLQNVRMQWERRNGG